MKNEKKKTGKALNPFIPLVLMVLACAIASYFVVPGAYDRETVNGVTRRYGRQLPRCGKNPHLFL